MSKWYIMCMDTMERPAEWAPESATASVSTRELREGLAELLARARYAHERIVVTKNGKPAGAIIGMEDLELLERLEDLNDRLQYDEAKAKAKAEDDSENVPWEQAKAELGL
ncbi:prevent-host-death family protein [Isoptericola sp. CG 20/1183]|uniref:Antitoxin n=2 Tax=Promicromonosporaceae TaxID=85017 RepID=A0ABX5EAV5_9MICO|nr:prevent-host-death family protein [Isoptericola sp. CG 20/1183]PRZ03187.1 prevent-host-death family protein [Isoptericola halotolerans]